MLAPSVSRSQPPVLQRTTFEMSRAAEYLTVRELQAMTGQPRQRFVVRRAEGTPRQCH